MVRRFPLVGPVAEGPLKGYKNGRVWSSPQIPRQLRRYVRVDDCCLPLPCPVPACCSIPLSPARLQGKVPRLDFSISLVLWSSSTPSFFRFCFIFYMRPCKWRRGRSRPSAGIGIHNVYRENPVPEKGGQLFAYATLGLVCRHPSDGRRPGRIASNVIVGFDSRRPLRRGIRWRHE